MLLSRRAYVPEEKWDRLKHVTEEVRAIAKKHKVTLDAPPSATIRRIREELEMKAAADRVLEDAFSSVGELGDRERVRVFPLLDLPPNMPVPFVHLPEREDVAASLGLPAQSAGRSLFDRWFLIDRSEDGDTVTFLREQERIQIRREPHTGELRTESRIESDEIDLRLDRQRRVLFTSGGTHNTALHLANAVASYSVGSGISLTLGRPPEISAAVLHALVDSFDGKPRKTNIVPNDKELLPWKDVGTVGVDIRQHTEMTRMMSQGQQTALTGVFARDTLGGSNACPESVEVQVDILWNLTPGNYIEPAMIMRLFDRLADLSQHAGLLRPIDRAVEEALTAAGSARLTPALLQSAVEDTKAGLREMGAQGRPGGGTSQYLFDVVVLNLLLHAAACPALSVNPKRETLDSDAIKKITDAVAPGITKTERGRLRSILESAVAGDADYMTVLRRAAAMLRKAKC